MNTSPTQQASEYTLAPIKLMVGTNGLNFLEEELANVAKIGAYHAVKAMRPSRRSRRIVIVDARVAKEALGGMFYYASRNRNGFGTDGGGFTPSLERAALALADLLREQGFDIGYKWCWDSYSVTRFVRNGVTVSSTGWWHEESDYYDESQVPSAPAAD